MMMMTRGIKPPLTVADTALPIAAALDPDAPENQRFVDKPFTSRLFGDVSGMTLDRWEADPEIGFPARVRLGPGENGPVHWWLPDLLRHRAKIMARSAKAAGPKFPRKRKADATAEPESVA